MQADNIFSSEPDQGKAESEVSKCQEYFFLSLRRLISLLVTFVLTKPRGFLLLIERCVGVALFAVGGVLLDRASRISRKLAIESCEISSRRKHGH